MRNYENKSTSPTGSPKNFIKALGIGFMATAFSLNPITGLTNESFAAGSKNTTKSKTEHVSQNENFIDSQISEIKDIILNKEYDRIISNPYLAYCLYYSQTFLDRISDPKNQHNVAEKIIGRIAPLITPEFKENAIEFLREKTKKLEISENKNISTKKTKPLKSFNFGQGESHDDAIDLFTNEGNDVCSIEGGIVLVSEDGWKLGDETSTSSVNGGNTVVIWNYLTREFSRYAHLSKTFVKPGALIMPGEKLGTVGHSGKNAAKPGHGGHVHFEKNKYNLYEKNNQIISAHNLKKILGRL